MANDDKKHHTSRKRHPASARARPAPAPAPPPARASSTSPNVGRTAKRPVAAKTPAGPPRRTDAPRQTGSHTAGASDRSDRRPGQATRATPKPGHAGAYYTRPDEVRLRPGQTLGYTAGKGYYATTRPSPIKGSTRPWSRTTKVVALSTRASTESPLREDVETRDGKTTVRLSHATKPGGERASLDKKAASHASERFAKPHVSAAKAHATRKASSRVDHELARTRQSAGSTAAASSVHQPHKLSFTASLLTLGTASVLKRGAAWHSGPFPVGEFLAETSVKASVTGPTVRIDPITGQVVVAWGKRPLLSTSIGSLVLHGVEITEQLHKVAIEVKDGKPVTKQLTEDATVTYQMGVSGPSFTVSVPGGEATVRLHGGQIVIAMTVKVPAPAHSPLTNHPVNLSITTTLTPAPPPTPRSSAPGIIRQPATVHQTAPHATVTVPAYEPAPSWPGEFSPHPGTVSVPEVLGILGFLLGVGSAAVRTIPELPVG